MQRAGADGGPFVTVLVSVAGGVPGERLPLTDDEVHHLNVRRVETGAEVRLRNGRGLVGRGRVELGKRGGVIEILTSEQLSSPAPLLLAVGAGDRDRFAWLIEKASELGVTDLVPLTTRHTADVEGRLRANMSRLERRALESTKQSGAPWATVIHRPTPVAEFAAAPPRGARLLADLAGGAAPTIIGDQSSVVAIGPEAGFTQNERADLLAAGFAPIALGPYVLRFETAAIAAAAVVRAALHRGSHAS